MQGERNGNAADAGNGIQKKEFFFLKDMSVIGPLRKEWLVHLNTLQCTAKTANTSPPWGRGVGGGGGGVHPM